MTWDLKMKPHHVGGLKAYGRPNCMNAGDHLLLHEAFKYFDPTRLKE